jgi:deazaflavin-dependent oxidoreductase (nitroreductase family)
MTQRTANWYFLRLTKLGLGLASRHVLTVRGRKSGLLRVTPVDVMDFGGDQWLVAPYGIVNWVRNVRDSQEVMLRRGRVRATYRAEEVDARMSVPVLRQYIKQIKITRAYWECGYDATDDALMMVSKAHPVFRLRSVARTKESALGRIPKG